MDHIKKEFTNILEKETEFLDAMSAYYKPESETLADEMKRQKEQMEGLRSTIGDARTMHMIHELKMQNHLDSKLTDLLPMYSNIKTSKLNKNKFFNKCNRVV